MPTVPGCADIMTRPTDIEPSLGRESLHQAATQIPPSVQFNAEVVTVGPAWTGAGPASAACWGRVA
jgi:hypothetical protein